MIWERARIGLVGLTLRFRFALLAGENPADFEATHAGFAAELKCCSTTSPPPNRASGTLSAAQNGWRSPTAERGVRFGLLLSRRICCEVRPNLSALPLEAALPSGVRVPLLRVAFF